MPIRIEKEVGVIILWDSARSYPKIEANILEDIAKNDLEILETIEISWDKKLFVSNISRFYGIKDKEAKKKAKHCGSGKFLLITILDKNPNYQCLETSRGHDYVNEKFFNLKNKYRTWTGGGHKIHASNGAVESSHNLSLLLGINHDDYMSNIVKTTDPSNYKQLIVAQNT